MPTINRPRRIRRVVVHCARFLLFALIILLIHIRHQQFRAQPQTAGSLATIDVENIRPFFPAAASIGEAPESHGGHTVYDASGESLGYILQTSPDSDHLIGFSGPTNTLIAFAPDDRIIGVDILSSGDTKEHVRQVLQDKAFLNSFKGLTWKAATKRIDVDGVSGATLTSLTIQEAIIHRLGGGRPSLRFPDPVTAEDARGLFESAEAVEQDAKRLSLWHVKDKTGAEIGSILRTSPAADNIVGYQGPTETLIGFGGDGRVVGISLGKSYDNEPYVTYVREDKYFLTLFNDLVLEELAKLDLEEAEVEGVSGATMTSMAVAKSLIVAADEHQQALATPPEPPKPIVSWALRDAGTALVILVGLVIAMTPLRAKKWLRVSFQLVLIGYLGLINGDMVSQAMIVGWAQNGVPWQTAGGLVFLTVAAFLVPLTTRRNAYCTHLCPHGAVQQLVKNRLPWQLHLPPKLMHVLKIIPVLLLGWCVVVAMAGLPFSLVDIEPFDAWIFRVAGWATITVAIVGLVASLFVPMAYCRYGCPTGALLNFLRLNSRSGRWSARDWLAVGLVALAFGTWGISS